MNLTEIKNNLNSDSFYKNDLVSRVSKILENCEQSKNLLIGIYLVEQGHFLYANQNLQKILGKNSTRFLEEGLAFWFLLIDSDECLSIQSRVVNFLSLPSSKNPLLMRYHITDFEKKRIAITHEIILHKLNGLTLAINYFADVTDKERIEGCFSVTTNNNRNRFSKKCHTTISSREREVLLLVADGFSSKQIADMLFISNHTAISHRKNLIEKFGVKNTAQLIKKASKVMVL